MRQLLRHLPRDFYNRRRLRKHRTFGYLTPAETRQRHQHALAA
ncbi:hypothetical protein ACFXMT_29505 [Streptomyces mirabilis]